VRGENEKDLTESISPTIIVTASVPHRPLSKWMSFMPPVWIHTAGTFYKGGATKAAQMGADIVVWDT
jgi:hypothetical protein